MTSAHDDHEVSRLARATIHTTPAAHGVADRHVLTAHHFTHQSTRSP